MPTKTLDFATGFQTDLADSNSNPAVDVTVEPSGNLASDNVQDALEELQTDVDTRAPQATTYTKTEVDTALAAKADQATTYTKTEVDQQITDLVGGAPGALDTLNELAQALNDDANFAATVTNELAQKADIDDVYTKTATDTLLDTKADEANPSFTGYVEIAESTTPATPASGKARAFVDSADKKLKVVDSTGLVSTGGGSGSGTGEINVVENPSAASDVTGWAASGAGITVARTTTSSDLPLAGVIDTAIKITPVSSTDYVRYRWTMPAALKQRKLKVEWHQRPLSGYATGDLKVEVYKNSASDYSGSYTEFDLSTDSSGTTSIPNATGKFTTTFQADDADYYELRVVRTAGTTALNIAAVVIGPGIQPQGAAVGRPQTYTPTLTLGGGATSSSLTSNSTWTRDGEYMVLDVDLSFTTATATPSSVAFSLPTGYTVGGNSGQRFYGNGDAFNLVTNRFDIVLQAVQSGTTVSCELLAGNAFSATGAGRVLRGSIQFPISEWAGSGTLNVAQNDVEYAYNSETSSASDATSFAYGPAGALFPNRSVGTTAQKRVKFQSPIQSTDLLILEYWDGSQNGWQPLSQRMPYVVQGTVSYGVVLSNQSSTEVNINFQSGGATASNTTYAQNGQPFSDYYTSGWKWRVKKVAGGAAVGFGLATSTASGLVKLPNAQVRMTGGSGHGSTNTKIRRFTTAAETTGTGITVAQSATLGDTFTINEAGVYAISYTDGVGASTTRFGVSVNSSALTTNIDNAGNDSFRRMTTDCSSTTNGHCSVTLRLSAGDVVRAHTQGLNDSTSAATVMFTMTQICKL